MLIDSRVYIVCSECEHAILDHTCFQDADSDGILHHSCRSRLERAGIVMRGMLMRTAILKQSIDANRLKRF